MKILVLGGTGAMGTHLVDLLVSNGMTVAVTSRFRSGVNGSLRYIQGDAHCDSFVEDVLRERWDAIVDFMNYSTSAFERRMDVLLNATPQYIFLSSARVYADSSSPISETTPRLLDTTEDQDFLSTDEYALAKAKQENLLIQSGKKNWTIIRPYITYSEERLQLGVLEKEDWLYRALHGRTIFFSEDINSKITTLTYGFDVSKGMKAVLGKTDALGEIFHITSSSPVLWKDVLAVYMDVLEQRFGSRPKVVLQNLNDFCKWRQGKYQILYDRMFNRTFDNKKISQHVNTSEFSEPLTEIRRCLEAFLEKPVFRDINWLLEVKKDRLAKEYTPLSEIPTLKRKIKYLVARNIPFIF